MNRGDAPRASSHERPDHSTYREWLNLEADGQLPPRAAGPARRAPRHLSGAAATERDETAAPSRACCASNRVPVRQDFRDARPRVPARRGLGEPRARAPGASRPRCSSCSPGSPRRCSARPGWAPPRRAVARSRPWSACSRRPSWPAPACSAATWKGLGLVFAEMLASPMSLGVFGVLVLCLNLLLVSLVRRRRPACGRRLFRSGPSNTDDTDQHDDRQHGRTCPLFVLVCPCCPCRPLPAPLPRARVLPCTLFWRPSCCSPLRRLPGPGKQVALRLGARQLRAPTSWSRSAGT